MTDLAELHSFLHSEMSAAQKCYQGPADPHRAPPPDFQIGDQVFVKAKFFCSTHPSKKLSEKFLGPYSIIARPGTHSFTLKLPDSMCSIHPVFHIAQLEPATPNTIPERFQPHPPLVEVDGKLEYKIAEILDSKVNNHHQHCKLLYLVCWAGYAGTDEETSWLLATELGNALELVQDFHRHYLSRPVLRQSYLSRGQGVRARSSGKTERLRSIVALPKG